MGGWGGGSEWGGGLPDCLGPEGTCPGLAISPTESELVLLRAGGATSLQGPFLVNVKDLLSGVQWPNSSHFFFLGLRGMPVLSLLSVQSVPFAGCFDTLSGALGLFSQHRMELRDPRWLVIYAAQRVAMRSACAGLLEGAPGGAVGPISK